jgi:hypothetical protein
MVPPSKPYTPDNAGISTTSTDATHQHRAGAWRAGVAAMVPATAILAGMSQLPLDPPPSPPPPNPKLTADERRIRLADRLKMIRLRMMISQALADNGITTVAGIGAAIDMLGPDAVKLLSRKHWREGDVALLEAAATRLGLQVSG